MNWNDPLSTSLLDFLFEAKQNGLKSPLTVAGGFGLFLKKQYLIEHGKKTLFPIKGVVRSTEDIDLFVHVDILCDQQQFQCILNTLRSLGYEVVDSAKYMQWKKSIDLREDTGYVKIDFLAGNVDVNGDKLHTKSPRVRNRQVEGLHAHVTPEALFIDEKALEIPFAGERNCGVKYQTTICIPHPFTYLLMKLFAFRDRENDTNRQSGAHHAFDIFTIIGSLTEAELDETIDLAQKSFQEPVFQEARQIVMNRFTTSSQKGTIAIRSHELYFHYEVKYLNEFLNVMTEIFGTSKPFS